MGDRSKIEWTDASWNPIRAIDRTTGKKGWHCEHLSPGCANCYSEGFNARLGTQLPFKPGHRADVEIVLDPTVLLQPLRWTRPRMIFVCSMTDLFADFVPDAFIDQVFAVMALCPQHTFQVLTKRSARMRAYMADPAARDRVDEVMDDLAPGHWCSREVEDFGGWPLPNIWLGVSTEDQRRADERVPDLLATPAAVRFVSAEPLLGPVDLTAVRCPNGCAPPDYCNRCYPDGRRPTGTFNALGGGTLDWIIVGGESGRGARPMHVDWARGLRDQCAAEGASFFLKQWGEWAFEGQTAFQPGCAFFNAAGEPIDEKPPFGPRTGARWHWWEPNHLASYRVGKKVAGRLLDGVEHNGMPQVATAPLVGAA